MVDDQCQNLLMIIAGYAMMMTLAYSFLTIFKSRHTCTHCHFLCSVCVCVCVCVCVRVRVCVCVCVCVLCVCVCVYCVCVCIVCVFNILHFFLS